MKKGHGTGLRARSLFLFKGENMIKHVYLIKLKDFSRADEAVKTLATLKDNIPEIHRMELGKDFIRAGVSYDIIEVCEFLSEEDFEIFTNHPYHDEIRKYISSVKEDAVKVDYRIENQKAKEPGRG